MLLIFHAFTSDFYLLFHCNLKHSPGTLMNTRQVLSCGSGYTRNCITDAYIKTVGARSLRAHLESVKTSVQGRGIYLYVKRKKLKFYITLTRAYILIRVYSSSALHFTLNTLNPLSLHHTKVVQKRKQII